MPAKHPASVVIHGHFYQPPREDPWFESVPPQPSAAPYHDWNRRIEHECYRAVIAARVPAADGRIARIVNALAWMSFDFGPTLLGWLEREAPDTYEGVLRADRLGRARCGGFGGALAQPYHHTILPLASRREKTTEVRWGIADFRRRFRRDPQGMWLPEAAVDDETLDVLAQEGIAFTVLAPRQIEKVPGGGRPGSYRTRAGGRALAIFVYDRDLSHDLAFGELLGDADAWVRRMLRQLRPVDVPTLLSLAADGETFGHHYRLGEMALAAAIDGLDRADVRVENFASFLDRHPPVETIELIEPSSWSCEHGVERWRADCGCREGEATSQSWRAPLREAMEWLADRLHEIFIVEGRDRFRDPWAAREAYGAVASTIGTESFASALERHLEVHASGSAGADRVRAIELLEMERSALRLFTSCGWYFDDIARIEAVQLLRYAAHALELAGERGGDLSPALEERLSRAKSNDEAAGDGWILFRQEAARDLPAGMAAAACAAAAEAAGARGNLRVGAFAVRCESGRMVVTHSVTGRFSAYQVAVKRSLEAPTWLEVRPVGEEGEWEIRPVRLDELPPVGLELIRSGLVEGALERCLAGEAKRALRTGVKTINALVAAALCRTIRRLSGGCRELEAQFGNLIDLLDLLDLQGCEVPFCAQTEFWRVWESAEPAARPGLRPLGHRLGFALSEAP